MTRPAKDVRRFSTDLLNGSAPLKSCRWKDDVSFAAFDPSSVSTETEGQFFIHPRSAEEGPVQAGRRSGRNHRDVAAKEKHKPAHQLTSGGLRAPYASRVRISEDDQYCDIDHLFLVRHFCLRKDVLQKNLNIYYN